MSEPGNRRDNFWRE